MAFVVDWVLRWEAFAERYSGDRLEAIWRAQRPQTSDKPNAHPQVTNVDVQASLANSPDRLNADRKG